MLETTERRSLARPVEFRASDSGPGTLVGYAATYNRYSQNLGGFVELVMPGAFAKSLADENPVLCRYNHDDNWLLGTTAAGTLRLLDDNTGLGYECDLPDTTAGRDVAVLARRGDVQRSSFAFRTIEDDWDVTEQGFPVRKLISARLFDTAPVNTPAYLDTSSAVRSFSEKYDVEPAVFEAATPEEIRSLIQGEHIDIPAVEARQEQEAEGQRATHPDAATLRRRLEFEEFDAPAGR
ncbi:HK97 family phage prohead protease [Galbitalea sp. SE-J8]|uniref:HK97 family phage prohead protease n=1 Tax=Galbitalea sp. SE-J8 TaxID=3054952 RepID=UPI00259C6D01|nr:HK97 family phage prohead protease [Galbitalea sp. SE-J8]MDM4761890.1 HK97 family phage prohead protease [Galbitalea sp. SE-J8]